MNKSTMILRFTFVAAVFLVMLMFTACDGGSASAPAGEAAPTHTAVPEPTVPPVPEPEPTAASTAEPVVSEPAETTDGIVKVVTVFDAARMEFPEGITMDHDGNTYISLGLPFWLSDVEYFGEIRKISADGAETILTKIDGPSAAGLAIDPSGTLYYAYPSGDEGTQGVYRLTEEGGTERLPGTEGVLLANGVAIGGQGDVFVTDSILGAVWRMPGDGSADAEIWFQHEWLAGCPDDPIGANGLAFGDDALYVASTVKGLLVRVPVEQDGSAGEAELVAGDDECDAAFDELDSMDGIALDEEGHVYAFLVMQGQLVRIDPATGDSELLLTGDDGLHNPASIVFGTTENDRESIYLTNFAILPPAPDGSLGPSILKADVGAPGRLLP